MGRPKGGNNKTWTKEQKYEIIEPIINKKTSCEARARELGLSSGMVNKWVHRYYESGIDGLENIRKPGNPLVKYMHKKELTDVEKLEYENLKLRIENERLKKGYYVKGDGTILVSTKLKNKNSK